MQINPILFQTHIKNHVIVGTSYIIDFVHVHYME